MTTKGWGETGSDLVPDAVRLQVEAQLACADKETAFVAALLGYRDFRWYEIHRDRALFDDAILPVLREFWRLVETETPPEPDGSDGYGSFLRSRFPTDAGTERAATPEEQLLGLALVEAVAAKEAAALREDELKQRLMLAMGDTTKLDGPGWRVTWKRSKDATRTKWDAVAKAHRSQFETVLGEVLRAGVQIDAPLIDPDVIESIHTETKPGPRPFLFRITSTEEAE